MTPKCHILVIDGDGDVRDLIVEALQSAGYAVSTASDGREVLDQITLQPVHAVVLDVTASREAGMKLDEQLEALRLPFVMMSGSWEALEAADGTRPRMLRKPFGATDLYEAIETALAAAASGRRLEALPRSGG
jgi:DNA-binding NtrC family response regulator